MAPFSSTGQGNTGSTAMLKGHSAATPRYSALRVNTMSDSQKQKAVAWCAHMRNQMGTHQHQAVTQGTHQHQWVA
jgi:hypothetical protein